MKSKKNLLEQLKSLPHFGKDSVRQLGEQLGLATGTVDTYINRFLKQKEIFQLKKGLYVSTDFFSHNRDDISYPFYLANIIRTPSYVSSWSALQFYNLTTEVIRSVISVTPKVTRAYQTKVGNFDYQSIQTKLFSDFCSEEKSASSNNHAGKFNFFIASPAKALFDLLYFKTRQFRGVRPKDVKALIEELRIDLGEMDKKEKSKFCTMMEKHLSNE